MKETCVLITGSNRGYGKAGGLSKFQNSFLDFFRTFFETYRKAIASRFLEECDKTCRVILHSRSGQIEWLCKTKYDASITVISGDFRNQE